MKIKGLNNVGPATIGEWAVGIVLVVVLVWRSAEGDTFGETTTWLLGLGAAATAVLSGWRRSWQERNK